MPLWAWLVVSVVSAGVATACKEQGVTALGVGLLLHASAVFTTTPRSKVSCFTLQLLTITLIIYICIKKKTHKLIM